MEHLVFHRRQRPGVGTELGDKGLELDRKRTKECWQQVKQELGILHFWESHFRRGSPLKSAHKERLSVAKSPLMPSSDGTASETLSD